MKVMTAMECKACLQPKSMLLHSLAFPSRSVSLLYCDKRQPPLVTTQYPPPNICTASIPYWTREQSLVVTVIPLFWQQWKLKKKNHNKDDCTVISRSKDLVVDCCFCIIINKHCDQCLQEEEQDCLATEDLKMQSKATYQEK